MEISSKLARRPVLAGVAAAVLAGCASADPWTRQIRHEEEKAACIELMESRLAGSLGAVAIPGDLVGAAKVVVGHLPEQEKTAVLHAGSLFQAEFGARALPRGGEPEQKAYWSALYRGFSKVGICAWSGQLPREYMEAAIFTDTLDTLLRSRGVDTGSPTLAHTDLIRALVHATTGLASSIPATPTPSRGQY